jgi:raffinose/stachyose/melibiose transport system permease protein
MARQHSARQPNWLAGTAGWLWLAVIIVPIYYVLITSFKKQSAYYDTNALVPPADPTFENYRMVFEAGIGSYFINSIIVTVATVIPALTIALMASYVVVRGRSRYASFTHSTFLLGLSVPLQASVVPIYLIIAKAGLYDTLAALVLPSIAFALPITILILSNFMRDIPSHLFEAMAMDGAGHWWILWRLVLPMTRPALVTVGIYDALHVWNAFLLPLILTQSQNKRVLPLSLWAFQGEFSVNIPATLAAVVVSTLPLLLLYVFGRRQLIAGLSAGFSK